MNSHYISVFAPPVVLGDSRSWLDSQFLLRRDFCMVITCSISCRRIWCRCIIPSRQAHWLFQTLTVDLERTFVIDGVLWAHESLNIFKLLCAHLFICQIMSYLKLLPQVNWSCKVSPNSTCLEILWKGTDTLRV